MRSCTIISRTDTIESRCSDFIIVRRESLPEAFYPDRADDRKADCLGRDIIMDVSLDSSRREFISVMTRARSIFVRSFSLEITGMLMELSETCTI